MTSSSQTALVMRFNHRMCELYENARQAAPFLSVRNLPTLGPEDGLPTAQSILAAANTSPAFAELMTANCEALTVEHLVLQPPYSQLFTPGELEVARKRLNAPAPEGFEAISTADLAARFERRLRRIYETARDDMHYDARHFIRLLESVGAVEAAREVLANPAIVGGLAELAAAGRNDLSIEAVILERSFAPLFTTEELIVARRISALMG
jgi:hypothetical protein